MASIETEARLDLIQLAANIVGADDASEHGDDDDQLLDLIEVLCRYRDIRIEGLLTKVHTDILQARAADAFEWFRLDHGIRNAPSAP